MLRTEHLKDFIRMAVGTIVCLWAISVGQPDLLNISLTLGETTIVGIVPIVILILALGLIFFGGYVFFIFCEAVPAVIKVMIKTRRSISTER